jgi:hypothetical protein
VTSAARTVAVPASSAQAKPDNILADAVAVQRLRILLILASLKSCYWLSFAAVPYELNGAPSGGRAILLLDEGRGQALRKSMAGSAGTFAVAARVSARVGR